MNPTLKEAMDMARARRRAHGGRGRKTPSQVKAHIRKEKEFLQKQAKAAAAAAATRAKAAARNAASTARNVAQTHGIPSMPRTNMIPV